MSMLDQPDIHKHQGAGKAPLALPLIPSERTILMDGTDYALIDISANHFTGDRDEVDYYIVSALAHINPPPGDDSPTEYGESREYDTRSQAIAASIKWANELLDDRECEQVTVFCDGNEIKTIYRQSGA